MDSVLPAPPGLLERQLSASPAPKVSQGLLPRPSAKIAYQDYFRSSFQLAVKIQDSHLDKHFDFHVSVASKPSREFRQKCRSKQSLRITVWQFYFLLITPA